jgi:hypothetical protein
MEPEPLVPTWDTLDTYRRLRKLAEEKEGRGRRSQSPRHVPLPAERRSKSRDFGPGTDWKAAQRQNWRQELARERVEETRAQKRRPDRGERGGERGDQGKRRRYDEEYGDPRRHSAEDDYYYQGTPGIREPSYERQHRNEGLYHARYDADRRAPGFVVDYSDRKHEFAHDSGRSRGFPDDSGSRRREYSRQWDGR